MINRILRYGATASVFLTMWASIAHGQSDAQARTVVDERPLYVTQPAVPDLDADLKTLRSAAEAGNLGAYKSVSSALAAKWEPKDKLAYLCVLGEECSDLTSFDFGFRNVAAAASLRDATCELALQDRTDMGLAMQAYFVEHLNYVPGNLAMDTGARSWAQVRSDRAKLWLETWQEISERMIPDLHLSIAIPPLPDRKYISARVIIDGAISASDITDPVERKRYADAWKIYYSNQNTLMEQSRLTKLYGEFRPLAVQFLTSAYESSPSDLSQLQDYFEEYQVDQTDQNLIVASVTDRANPDR